MSPAAPPPASAARQQRRQVSVLFLDVVGSTAMSRELDPEDVQEIMDGALRDFTQVVQQHAGTVLQYAGDSLLAAFGTPRAREDDAERAVHAGLALLASAREHAARVRRRFGIEGFDIRLGVHTGHVLLGGGVDEDGTIRGFTVNVAARLEQTAPPGHLRISQETWRHVRGVFEAQAQEPIVVKGQDEPLATWFVQGVRPRAFRLPTRGVEGVETPLIGRDEELGTLMAGFEHVLAGHGLAGLTVVADPGVGKSRVMHELQHRLDGHPRPCWLLLARAGPSGQLRPYGLLRDLLAWRLGIADSDSASVAREKWLSALVPLLGDGGPTLACALGHLVGLDFSAHAALAGLHQDGRLLRDRAFAAFARYVQALAQSDEGSAADPARLTPVVMLVDDLHWADDASLDWLQQLMTQAELPLFLVAGARPRLLERRAAWGAKAPNHRRIRLEPLQGEQARALGSALLQRLGEVPHVLADLLEQRAEGNPYYAEELVQMLLDDGVITREDNGSGGERWHLHRARLDGARIPGTLVGVLQARLDSLAAAERRVLQQASIIGPVFWDQALAATVGPEADPRPALPLLQLRGMVQPHAESAFEGTREQAFHHHLLHQVTYDTVLKAERRAGHARAAAWLAERVGDREGEYLAVTAEHYERAGQEEEAARWYLRAATSASRLFAHAGSSLYADRGMALLPETALELRWEFEFLRYATADVLAQRDEQERAGQACVQLAEAMGNEHKVAHSLVSLALAHDRRGDYTQARVLSERALALARRVGDPGRIAASQAELAWIDSQQGDLNSAHGRTAEAVQAADDAAVRAVSSGDDIYAVTVRLVASHVEQRLGQPGRAAQLCAVALERARTIGRPRPLLITLATVANQRTQLGDAVQGQALAQECLKLATAIGLVSFQAMAHHILGEAAVHLQEREAALHHLEESVRLYREAGQPQQVALVIVPRARARAAVGRLDDALQDAADALAYGLSAADEHRSCLARLLQAELLRRRGELQAARALVDAELRNPELEPALSAGMEPPESRTELWRVLHAAGDSRARAQLELALAFMAQVCARLPDPQDRERFLRVPAVSRELLAAARAAGLALPPELAG